MAERHYSVEPIDVEGEPFTLEGLQAVLDKIHDTWGGKPHKAASVSPALSLGKGAAILGVETGRVMIARDDAAREVAKARAAQDAEPDGRIRSYRAECAIVRVIGPNRAEPFDTREIEGTGLMGLFFSAAMYVQEALGDAPDCMSFDTCEIRERGARAQMSRAKSQGRASTYINFPGSQSAQFFEVASKPGEYYRAVLTLYLVEPETLEELPQLPRR